MAKRNRYLYTTFEKTRHGKTLVYFRRGKGLRTPLLGEVGSPEFVAAYEAALRDDAILHVREMKVSPIEARKQKTESTLKGAIRSCKTRARQKGVPFDLDLDFLLDMAEEQEFRCGLTGIEFFAPHSNVGRVDPYTPSVDRIVPSLGYVRGNVRLVTYAVNAMILDWGEDLFHQIANSYRYWSRTKKARRAPELFSKAPNRGKIYEKSNTYVGQQEKWCGREFSHNAPESDA